MLVYKESPEYQAQADVRPEGLALAFLNNLVSGANISRMTVCYPDVPPDEEDEVHHRAGRHDEDQGGGGDHGNSGVSTLHSVKAD